jgi:hypothetical protein
MILLQRIWNCVILSFTTLSCILPENQPENQHDYEESLLQKCEESDLDVSSYEEPYEPPFVINELI